MQHQKRGKNTVKLHTVEVTGSNPVPPTSKINNLEPVEAGSFFCFLGIFYDIRPQITAKDLIVLCRNKN
jgi:hypothetical protein